MDALLGLGHWTWLVIGTVLVGLEILAPGVFLIWLGIAAILTGLAGYVLEPSWQASLLIFGVLAIASVAVGWLLSRRRRALPDSLNRRGDVLVGRLFVLDRPVVGGEGQVRVDDSVWRVTGPDLPAGAGVRVVRRDGATLVVEPSGG